MGRSPFLRQYYEASLGLRVYPPCLVVLKFFGNGDLVEWSPAITWDNDRVMLRQQSYQ